MFYLPRYLHVKKKKVKRDLILEDIYSWIQTVTTRGYGTHTYLMTRLLP